MKYGKTLIAGTFCAAATLIGVTAMAQQQQEQPQPQQPAQDQRATPAPQQQQRRSNDDAFERGFGRGGMMGRNMRNMSEADRAAFFEARLAAVRAGLMLTDAQQGLWPPVESAVREMVKQRQEWAQRVRNEPRPDNFADRMKRSGEMMSARGAAMTKFADAVKPFYDSLSVEQKTRLQVLMRPHGERGRGGRMGRDGDDRRGMGMRGEHRQRWHNEGRRDWGGQRGERGDDRGWNRGGRGDDDRGSGRRWRQDSPDGDNGYGRGNGRRM